MPPPITQDQELNSYLTTLLTTLHSTLQENLLGVYLFGSAAYNAYERGVSDVDVYAVIKDPLQTSSSSKTGIEDPYRELARKISHKTLPCPARKLEFVLFTAANARCYTDQNPDPETETDPDADACSLGPCFSMNLNTGRGMDDHVSLSPENEEPFWFVLDIAIGRELGRVLYGPPVKDVFGGLGRGAVLGALAACLKWWSALLELGGGDGIGDRERADAVLNAARGLRFVRVGVWGSKSEGAGWVVGCEDEDEFGGYREVVGCALEARKGGEGEVKVKVPRDQAVGFLKYVCDEIGKCQGNLGETTV
ncbi:hypothetical protein BJY04DRAFT_217738 [Aspergillus karnatakaensis]|uniref:uncharacterized protein n=1 Tax=Aspergillus karnatakaensis TaxID=1810916 RepID=UPI003CCCE320